MKPRILFWDLETAGVNALKSDLGFVIVMGYKWLGEKKAHALTISKKDLKHFDDRNLLLKGSKLLAKADITVAHFGSVFDRRFFQGRLLINKLPPIPATKIRDTCFIARAVANFSSNRLKHLAKILGLRNQKLENGWPNAWFLAMQGNMKAIKGLAHYCKGDVLALEDLYKRLLPFDNAHPRIYNRGSCAVCGSEVEYRGFSFVNDQKYRRFICKSCHKWGRETRRA